MMKMGNFVEEVLGVDLLPHQRMLLEGNLKLDLTPRRGQGRVEARRFADEFVQIMKIEAIHGV